MAMHKTPGSLAAKPVGKTEMNKARMSAPQGTATGTGARPETKGKHKLQSSAPENNHHLDGRHVAGALK